MTREELIEVMARAILRDYEDGADMSTHPVPERAATRHALAALAALEAAGARLVPSEATKEREMSKDDGGAAFPQSMERYGGLTIRDWFAGQIAGGMAAHSGTMGTPFGPGDIAKRSYEIADALLTARDAQ